jgi:hypothetical protein
VVNCRAILRLLLTCGNPAPANRTLVRLLLTIPTVAARELRGLPVRAGSADRLSRILQHLPDLKRGLGGEGCAHSVRASSNTSRNMPGCS